MNKKILGFVLAMSLTLGLGVGNLFATTQSSSFAGYDNEIGTLSESSDGSITLKMTDNEEALVGNVKSRISSVFTYKAGMLLSVIDKDRNITLYDQGRPRMTLSYQAKNDGSGTGTGYAITSFNVYGTDMDDIKKVGGIKNYLKAFGFTDEQLSYTKDGEAGANNSNQLSVAWLKELEDHLAKGVNFSATINVTEGKGASVTLQEDGKNLKTIAYDGTVTQTFVYNAHGTLDYVESKTYKLKGSTTTSNDITKKGEADWEESYSRTYYNVYGQATSVKDADGNVTATYSYAYNGSMISSFDKATGNTTYYSAGKASYVLNSSGAIVQKYQYHTNGSLDGIYSYSYDDDGKQVKTEISAYKFGKFIGTADLSGEGGSRSFEEIRNAVAQMRGGNANFNQQDANHVNALREKLEEAKKSSDTAKIEQYEKEIREYTLAHSPDWVKSIQNGQESFKYVDGSTVVSNSSKFSNIKTIAIYSSDLENKDFLYSLGFTDADIAHMKATDNGTSALATATLTYGAIEHGSKTQDDGKTAYVGESTHKETTSVTKGQEGLELTISLTINDRGAQAYTVEDAIRYQIKAPVDEITHTTTVDPSLVGKYLGVEASDDGKYYMSVSASKMNTYDGTGYQAADGEIVKVEITAEEYKKLKGLAVGTDIMVNGDVSKSHDGYFTMTHSYSTDSDYMGMSGIVVGSDAIAKEEKKIANLEYKFAQNATASNVIIAAQSNTVGDWKAFFSFASGGTTNNKSVIEKKKLLEDDPNPEWRF